MKKVLESGRRFRVITFEHDAYVGDEFRTKSRELLNSYNYELRVPNVAFNEKNAFEDWWVLPGEVNSCFNEFSNKELNFAMDLFFEVSTK